MKNFFITAIFLFLLSGCASLSSADPSWRRITCYNNSDKPICVTSLEGISAYPKGKGPQDLGVGNLKPKALATINTMNNLHVDYPVTISWANNFLESSSSEWASMVGLNHQSIVEFRGLDSSIKDIRDEICLLLVFTGIKWDAYYIAGKSRLSKDEIKNFIKEP